MFQMDHEPVTVVLPPREKEEAEWEDVNMEGEELGQKAWGGVFEPLVDAYLNYTYTATPGAVGAIAPKDNIAQNIQVPAEIPIAAIADETLAYTVDVYCLFSRKTDITITRLPNSLSPALDLMLTRRRGST
ncbi:hypothetical protein BC835DRAFT_1417540 [Cytidiella melzeri]|nr:hypothetical protein BC835DRAFT_1420289 [Cytidiella melzeri]KAI0690868.1 hypothetical protein BC835DRAFT_1417540 [Cytidiella melzeri]